jgi:hypothetical protein
VGNDGYELPDPSFFCEMWDTAALPVFLSRGRKKVEICGIPHLAKNERDMGHPTLCGREKDKTQPEKSASSRFKSVDIAYISCITIISTLFR